MENRVKPNPNMGSPDTLWQSLTVNTIGGMEAHVLFTWFPVSQGDPTNIPWASDLALVSIQTLGGISYMC